MDVWKRVRGRVNDAIIQAVVAQDCLLTGFSAVQALRGSEQRMYKFATTCPRGSTKEAFADALVDTLNDIFCDDNVGMMAETSTYSGAPFVSVNVQLGAFESGEQVTVATISAFPQFPKIPETTPLDTFTWKLNVLVGRTEWCPRQLIPSLLVQYITKVGAFRVLEGLNDALAERELYGLGSPPKEQTDAVEKLQSGQVEKPAAAAAAAALPVPAASESVAVPPVPAAVVFPSAASEALHAVLEAPKPATDNNFGYDAIVSHLSRASWAVFLPFLNWLIQLPTLPLQLQVALPYEINLPSVVALHFQARTLYLSTPEMDGLHAYRAASGVSQETRFGTPRARALYMSCIYECVLLAQASSRSCCCL